MTASRRLILFYLLLALIAAPFAFQTVVSNDVWKSLYTGRYIAATLSFPDHGAFAFTPVQEGVMTKTARTWLGNLTFYGIWRTAGVPGLQGFRFLLILGCLALTHGIVDRRPDGSVLLLLVLSLFGLEQKLMLRNALFLIPGLTLLFLCWHRGVNQDRPGWLWGLPVLLIAWSNVHASYLAGLGLFGLLLTGETLDRLRTGRRPGAWLYRTVPAGLASLMGILFLNPYGPAGRRLAIFGRLASPGDGSLLPSPTQAATPAAGDWYAWVKNTMQGSVFGHVGGDQPVYSTDFLFPPEHLNELYVAASVGLVLVTLSLLMFTGERVSLAELLAFLAASWVGLSYLRTVALIPLTAGPILLMKAARGDYEDLEISRYGTAAVWGTVGMLLVLIGHRVFLSPAPDFAPTTYRAYGPGVHPRLSSAVPDHLLRHHREENFYNGYSLGSWLIWRWWPRKKVFVDSKSSAYQPSFRRDVLTKSDYRLIQKYDMSHALLGLGDPSVYFHFIPSEHWHVMGYDQGMIALRRSGPSSPAPRDEACRLLLERNELEDLRRPSRRYLRRVASFIRRFGRRGEHVGAFEYPPPVPPSHRDILEDPCMVGSPGQPPPRRRVRPPPGTRPLDGTVGIKARAPVRFEGGPGSGRLPLILPAGSG